VPRSYSDSLTFALMAALLVLLGLLLAVPTSGQAIDHTDLVAIAKAQVVNELHLDLDAAECNRWEVTRRVALMLKNDGAGLIAKSGNNCRGFATDAIMYRDGTVVDVLGAGRDGPSTPHWLVQPSKRPITDWRLPLPLDDLPVPSGTPEPAATQEDHDAILRRIDAQLETLRTEVAALKEQQAADTEKVVQKVEHVEGRLNEVVAGAKKSAAPLILKILSLGVVK
jgi:hypothetical protein